MDGPQAQFCRAFITQSSASSRLKDSAACACIWLKESGVSDLPRSSKNLWTISNLGVGAWARHPLPQLPCAATLKPPPGGSWSCGRIGPSLRASAAAGLAEKALGELRADGGLGTWECLDYPCRLMSSAGGIVNRLCAKPGIQNAFGCPAKICSTLPP